MGAYPSLPFNEQLQINCYSMLKDGDDLFAVIKWADKYPELRDMIGSECERRNSVKAITLMFHTGGIICKILYKKREFLLDLVETRDDWLDGNIIAKPEHPTSCKYLMKESSNPTAIVIKYFMQLFRVPTLHEVSFLNPTTSIIDYCIGFPEIFTARRMLIEKEKDSVSRWELEFIGDEFKNLAKVHLSAEIPEEYKLWPMKYTCVCLEIRSSVTGADLATFKGERLDVRDPLTTTEMNRFIKIWLVTKIKVEIINCYNTLNNGDLFDGLETYPWDKKARGKYYPMKHDEDVVVANCRNCMDIYRDDGTLASIHFDAKKKRMSFFVWKERFPMLPRNYSIMFMQH